MGIKVALRHQTKYIYDRAIKVWPQVIRLRPAPHSRTKILGYSLDIAPKSHFINWMQDPFGNYQAKVTFPDLVKEFVIDVEVIAHLVTINPFDFFLDEYAEKFPFQYDTSLMDELQPYLVIKEKDEELLQLHAACTPYLNQSTVDFLVALNTHVYQLLDYSIRMESGVQSCKETLTKKLGSCRDFAWLLVQLLRHFGLAARFVSGYLVQLTPDIKSNEGPQGPKQDFTDLHAWAEVFIPGAGWIGLDATSGLFAGEGHIPLSCTPDPSSAAPVTGLTEKANVTFEFFNDVQRIEEVSRVTKPYSKQQWQSIQQLGFHVDQLLQDSDARLSMGGEPTFISRKDMESAQWNTAADGEDKRKLALRLTHRLKEAFNPTSLLHFGQGKWYPGEPIPRWQNSIYWRNDNEPLWTNPTLLADPNEKGKVTIEQAFTFAKELTDSLGVDKDYILPAFEDRYYYLWEERNLPVNMDESTDLDKASTAQKTLWHLLEKGLDNPTGYVLPISWKLEKSNWQSCSWKIKSERLFLIPGNSQMGYRLPLDRLPVELESSEDTIIPADPLEHQNGIPSADEFKELIKERISLKNAKKTAESDSEKTIKTAICLEIRNGNLHIFLPPLEEINSFMDLIYSIEHTAIKLEIPVIIDGYQPPFHHILTKLSVTPDPGVIEVNIHPALNWNEVIKNYDILFREAESVGLGTNKYMLDGRHTGTGGGNHITLGGPSPADSPFLRRPDLLRSVINFWQNHPSLSYLFSSEFIGTTSQAPRVDEGRPDMIYELEIAFKELETLEDCPFWMVDRIFRNLLTDITGNTHRAELCIDKLYNPDSTSGRLGIVEFRAFDMPPHKEMCITQLLLIRSLIAAFWKNPYRAQLVNWENELHDKFMMHHYVREDIYEVIDFLNNSGIAFQKEWMDVFLNFRFPEYGSVTVNNINMTIRAGLEPWIVLGEEMSNTGTARFVDSSVERIEVYLENFNSERYILLCNDIRVPLHNTAFKSKFVAGIRYKAWAPSSAMHPTIGVHSPLIFNIYDTWNERTIGGCTYHIVHPGGRNYDTFPVNDLEAESRRMTRFWDYNHTPKSTTSIAAQDGHQPTAHYITADNPIKEDVLFKEVAANRFFPITLDLRRSGS